MSETTMKATVETKEKARIKIAENPAFEGDLKTKLTTTVELATLIGDLLAPVMPDYYGCRIRINNGNIDHGYPNICNTMEFGALYVDLYLKDSKNTKDPMKNLIVNGAPTASDGSKPSMADRLKAVVGSTANLAYTVSNETFELLEEFMPNGNRTQWRNHTAEVFTQINAPYGQNEVVVVISGLSLNALIAKIFGRKTEEGQYEYMATASTVIPYRSTEFVVTVAQLNADTVRKLQRTLGVYTPNTAIHTYTRR